MDQVSPKVELNATALSRSRRTRRPNVMIDQPGVKSERIVRLKKSRSSAKGILTKKQRELTELMNNPSNVDQVRVKVSEFGLAVKTFNEVHDRYHAELRDENAIRDSNEYFGAVDDMVRDIIGEIDLWLQSAQVKLQEKIDFSIGLHPEDSVSNIGTVKSNVSETSHVSKSKSVTSSRLSRASSSVSARLKASAKKAALEVEAATLKERQALQREELMLQQRKDSIKIRTELAKAAAQERVCDGIKQTHASTPHPQLPTSTPQGIKEESDDTPNDLAVPCPEHNSSSLNPEVPEWRSVPVGNSECFGDSPISYENVSQMVDLQRLQQLQNQQLQELLKQQQLQTLALTLPQPEVPVFSGDPVEYSDFVRAFENVIESKTTSPSTRMYYLVQYTAGEVKELMRSCLSMKPEEGYKTARTLLKSHYGQSYKIATALVDRITKTPQIKNEDGPALQRFSVMLTSCKNALKEIGYSNKLENPDALQRIIDKLPLGLRLKWRDKADTITEEWKREVTVEDVADFVEAKARVVNHPVFGNVHVSDQRNSVMNTDFKRKHKIQTKTSKVSAFATQGNLSPNQTNHMSSNSSSKTTKPDERCPLCQGNHWLSRCEVFRGNSVVDRLRFIRRKGLCDNCLMPGHMAVSCPKESFCRLSDCKFKHRKHTTFLHPKNNVADGSEALAQGSSIPSNTQAQEATDQAQNCFVEVEEGRCSATGAGLSSTGLAIVPVKVRAKGKNKMIETYAFLDPGSNTSFCTDQLIERLDAPGRRTTLSLTTMDSQNVTSQSLVVSLEVFDLQGSNSVELCSVFSRSKLPVAKSDVPLQSDVDRWPHLEGVDLPCIDADIDLLIGNDVPKALEPIEVLQSEDGGPYAVRTLLGWTINGPLGRMNHSNRTSNRIQSHVELDVQFHNFCEMEFNDSQFSITKEMSQEDRRALKMMEESTKLCDGHYEVALPWRVFPPDLPNNKMLAEHRLCLLKKRLMRDQALHRKYCSFMEDLFEKGHAQRVPNDQLYHETARAWYLPHHSVVHPRKPDKVRVVFDCAAKFQGTSLNQQLLQGPDLSNSLIGVLTRFREETTAIMADIESMFYQVRVPIEDSTYLRFLWWPNGDVNAIPQEFQMRVHLFGGASSPSCASYGLRKTADDNEEHFDKETVQTVRRNFYVDDCLKSVASEHRAVRLVDQLRRLLSNGGFRLTKWISNSRDVIESVPLSERAGSIKEVDLDNLPIERALGIQWDVQSDVFRFKIVVKDRPATRRGILSVVSSIYDPLGFVSPVILAAKAILRDLCKKGLGWDDKIPPEHLARWQAWLQELPKLQQFHVERCLKPCHFGRIVSSQLHNFSDASQEGYGAVSYLRVVNSERNIHCAFLIGKSRQNPLKAVTIPRLELTAAVVATRLSKTMLCELDVAIDKIFFWTDSECVLRYIANQDKRFHTFVANRVAMIHESSRLNQWNYVDTDHNPADDASRGLTAESLIDGKRWVTGPAFLWQEEDHWPKQPNVIEKVEENDPEIKKETKVFSLATTETAPLDRIIQSRSSWYRLKKLVAWILRYRSKLLSACRRRKQGLTEDLVVEKAESITVEEMNFAEREILKYTQRRAFSKELSYLQNQSQVVKVDGSLKGQEGRLRPITRSSSIYKLDPQLINGLLCVGGRLRYAPIEDEKKHPVILPKKHHVVDLIVRHFHTISGHSGQEHVLSLTRERFWIIKARVAVRSIISRCFSCRRRQGPVGAQKMADLPVDRVTPDKPPFSFVGVDCFGPFWVRRGRSQVKRYGVLFTCLALRAVHIEVAQTMDTDSFVNSMRRFIARRGTPEVVRSDNGTNFVSGNKEVRQAINEWNNEQIHEFLLQRNVKWIFNPPSGSHFGGVWERCIRTVRKVLNALLKEQTLDDEGLTTLMCEIESIVNGRPITRLSDDPSDCEALTPNHLLLLRSGPNLPPGLFRKEDTHSRRRWRQVQYMADVFWRRWVHEYLPQLQERQKWSNPSRNFAVGDVVLVVDDRIPRSSWPLGRVAEVHKNSKDSRVRSVSVKTRTTMLVRPIDKIVLLESVEMSHGT